MSFLERISGQAESTLSEPRDLQAIFAWSSLPQVGERTLLALLDHARESRQSLATLWHGRSDDLAHLVGLHPQARDALQEDAAAIWAKAESDLREARSLGVDVMLASQPDFPSDLWQVSGKGARRWPFLMAYGALELLEERRVALISSRDVSSAGLAITDALADALARRDTPLISSTSREAYQAAATAAKRHAGPSIMVLDRPFLQAIRAGLAREPVASARVWDEAFDPELQLLLSPFGWRESWSVRNGKRRDSLLFDLADVLVAIDVRADGHMEKECKRAVDRGRMVMALDRGAETPEGTRRLWETHSAIRRLTWRGAESIANEIAAYLPAPNLEAASERLQRGWLREISLFMCRMLTALNSPPTSILGYPEGGTVANIARLWGNRSGQSPAGLSGLVADLWTDTDYMPSRLTQLLERLTAGGCIAALVPATWLTDTNLAQLRAEWLHSARVRVTVGVPLPSRAGLENALPAAVLVLQREPAPHSGTQTFAPDVKSGCRFSVRRYLQEVLSAVTEPAWTGCD